MKHVASPKPDESVCVVCGGDAAFDELAPECPGLMKNRWFTLEEVRRCVRRAMPGITDESTDKLIERVLREGW